MTAQVAGQVAFLVSLAGTLAVGLWLYDRPAKLAHEQRMRDIDAWRASPIPELNYQQITRRSW